MEAHWKHLIYGSDYIPIKEENSSIKRGSYKSFSPPSSSSTFDNKQFNDVSSRIHTRFRHEFEKPNSASSQSEFNADGNIFAPQSSATLTSTFHSINKNQPVTSSTSEVDSQFPENLQEDKSKEINLTKPMRSDDVMNTSSKDRMESSSHAPILQPLNTHGSSKLHLKQSLNGNTEGYYRRTSVKNSGSGKYLLDSNGGLQGGDDVELAQGDEEPMSFTSQSCKSTEFDSLQCCSSGYEELRIQHFKVELKELKKEMQKVKLDNDALLKENQSLKEQLKRFHDNNITTSKGKQLTSRRSSEQGDCEISERSQNSTTTSRKFHAENISPSNLDKNEVHTNNKMLTRRRFSICSSTTENILQEAECFVRGSIQERTPTSVGKQTKRESSLSSSPTLNSHSEIESAYFNEPAQKCNVELGDVVRFVSKGGTIEQGRTMFVGSLPGKDFIYAGIELECEAGKHDGVYKGRRFFQCKRNRGIFVAASKIVSIPPKSLPKQGMNF